MSANPLSDRLQLVDWHPFRENTLRGFASLHLKPLGMIIYDLPVHRTGELLYALMPGKPLLDKDGRALIDESGKRRYVSEIIDRAWQKRLSWAVVELVHQRDPEALR